VRLRPKFLSAARRVQQDRIRPLRNHRCGSGWDDMPMRRPIDRVPQRRGGKSPATLDKMQIAGHAMMNVVRERRDRLANALPVESMTITACGTRYQCALHLLLQIQNRVVTLCSEVAAKRADIAPGFAREWRPSPPAQRERNAAANVRTQRDEGDEAALRDPIDSE